MRTAFIEALISKARVNSQIFLIVGDLGFSVVEPFAQEFPERFVNAGIAEQNMAGLAAGLASEGYRPFIYSIANFPTLRCIEQIRNDICYHELPATVVSVGAGLAYGNLGYSHHAVQDIGCLRGLPSMEIYSPADPGETSLCLDSLLEGTSPAYLRLGKAGEPELYAKDQSRQLQPLTKVSGDTTSRIALVATGSILSEAIKASDQCQNVCVYSMPNPTGINQEHYQALRQYQTVVVVEEHIHAGGIGEMIAGALSGQVRVVSLAIDRNRPHGVGNASHLRKQYGIDSAAISHHLVGLAAS